MSAKRKREWDDYKEKTSKKRTGKKNDEVGPSGLSGSITVQRLSPNVEGKCQKYSRIGALTLVLFEEEATLPNIKAACKSHFETELECDVLAGERGPSYTDASQIKDWKVIHIRFIEKSNQPPRMQSEPTKKSPRKESGPRIVNSSVAASIPLSQMLKLGKVIVPNVDIVTLRLEEFSVTEMIWLEPVEATFSIERNCFASGGFRDAYLAKAISGVATGKYVLKKYRKEKVSEIEDLFGTTEVHTRKSVQMNALARNFAQNLQMERPVLEYGNTFTYTKVYYSTLNGEFVTLESFLEGTFQKFINNTCEICGDATSEIILKAEAFVHYTFVKSNKQLMVTDIQGINYSLCDPEIASVQLMDTDGSSILFCSGNLSGIAINNFLGRHRCNKFCHLLKLEQSK